MLLKMACVCLISFHVSYTMHACLPHSSNVKHGCIHEVDVRSIRSSMSS